MKTSCNWSPGPIGPNVSVVGTIPLSMDLVDNPDKPGEKAWKVTVVFPSSNRVVEGWSTEDQGWEQALNFIKAWVFNTVWKKHHMPDDEPYPEFDDIAAEINVS